MIPIISDLFCIVLNTWRISKNRKDYLKIMTPSHGWLLFFWLAYAWIQMNKKRELGGFLSPNLWVLEGKSPLLVAKSTINQLFSIYHINIYQLNLPFSNGFPMVFPCSHGFPMAFPLVPPHRGSPTASERGRFGSTDRRWHGWKSIGKPMENHRKMEVSWYNYGNGWSIDDLPMENHHAINYGKLCKLT